MGATRPKTAREASQTFQEARLVARYIPLLNVVVTRIVTCARVPALLWENCPPTSGGFEIPSYVVVPTRPVERSFCGKSRHIRFLHSFQVSVFNAHSRLTFS
jgi:hypothetical protein